MRTASEQTSVHGSATRVQGAHTGALMPGALANAYSVLGVRPSAPIQEARAAWLRLVKELHPDAGFDDPTAAERLKSINQAYQTLKRWEHVVAAGRIRRRAYARARATFVVFLTLPVAAAVGLGTWTYWDKSGTAIHQADATGQQQKAVSSDPALGLGLGYAQDAGEKQVIAAQSYQTSLPEWPGDTRALPDATRDDGVGQANSDDVAWAWAATEATSVSLHRYLGRYPQGRHAQKAMQDVVQIAGVEVALGKNYGALDIFAIHAAVPVLRGYLANYPSGHLADEVRGKLAVIEAGAAVASEVEIERPDAHVSETIAVRAHQVPSSARVAELEGGGDAPAWSDAPRAATNEAASAYLPRRPQGRHAQIARTKVSELEGAAQAIKTDKQGVRPVPSTASAANSANRWPSADEPFVGVDGRVR
jgi:hypothetical protein